VICCPEHWPTPREELLAVVDTLGADEIRVLTRIGARLQLGTQIYGLLDVARDRRDFDGKEAREEVEDFLVYMACAWLRGAR
jgi:hypothetical protein